MNTTIVLRTECQKPLPTWARPEAIWTLGSELQPGDTIYLSSFSDPRRLDQNLQPDLWRSTIHGAPYGYGREIPNTLVEVDPDRWYVVIRTVQL